MKKMNSRRIIWAGTLLAGTMLFGGIAQGQVQQLVITENSSTSLTVTLNGTPIPSSEISGDVWTFTIPGIVGTNSWAEPDSTLVNIVQAVKTPSGLIVAVISDRNLLDFFPPGFLGPTLPNGGTDTTFLIGSAPLHVTFTDISDVPDTATTLPLLGLALAALGFAKRRLF